MRLKCIAIIKFWAVLGTKFNERFVHILFSRTSIHIDVQKSAFVSSHYTTQGYIMIKISIFHKAASAENKAAADAVIVPFRPEERPLIPNFMASAISDGDTRDETTKTDQRGPRWPELNVMQRRRAAKFFEAWTIINTLLAATDVKTFYIEDGRLIGSFLLKHLSQCASGHINVRYHGFHMEEWSVRDFGQRPNCPTIHVFHSEACGDVLNDNDAVKVECFVAGQHFSLPNYISEALGCFDDVALDYHDKRRTVTMFGVMTAMRTLQDIGASTVCIQGGECFDGRMDAIMSEEFPGQTEFFDYPEVEMTEAPVPAEEPVARAPKAAKAPVAPAVPKAVKKKAPATKRSVAAPADGAVSLDKLSALQAKFKPETAEA